jgi:hypothetical protein
LWQRPRLRLADSHRQKRITNYLFVGLPEGAGAHLRDDLVLTRVCERRSLSLS